MEPRLEQEVSHLEGRVVFGTEGEGERQKRTFILEADDGKTYPLLGHLGDLRADCRVRMSGAHLPDGGYFIYAYKLIFDDD